jgi:hypothetical protein
MSTPTFFDSRLGPGTLMLGTTEFGYQASAVKLTPSVDSTDGTPTLAVPDPAPESSVSWALNLDAIQDFENPAGIVNYLMDNALSEVDFTWTPLTDAGVVYSGTVQIVPMEVGGDVAVQVVTSVELPVVGEPTRVDGAPLASSIAKDAPKPKAGA